MTKQEQIKALAELDGWKPFYHQDTKLWSMVNASGCYSGYQTGVSEEHCWRVSLPHYLTSYDAIIPLIQEQSREILEEVSSRVAGDDQFARWWLVGLTPAQLCEALLRATGKWTTE